MSTEDRRAPGATRVPFEGLVEVGGALGPSFEAQAVNVSEEGMQLRTAYLPEAGQPLTCRFDAGPGQGVLASGEVVWTRSADQGGEFGIRFTEMDAESVDALKRACGLEEGGGPAPVYPGSKVRLHIEGLASPMRAKIKDARSTAITVGSDLGFLQVGKQLELEDAQSGSKRPACIDRVEVAVDPASHVPQLVVTLRYADVQAQVDAAAGDVTTPDTRGGDDLAAVEEASAKMKGAIARKLATVGPAVEQMARRAKTAVELLAKRRRERAEEAAAPRRTTAPAPGGGLHTAGRRVVRGETSSAGASPEEGSAPRKLGMTKRKAAVASAVMIAAVLGAFALKKSHHDAAADGNAASAASAPAQSASAAALANAAPPGAPGAPSTPSAAGPTGPGSAPIDTGTGVGTTTPADEPLAYNDDTDDAPVRAHRRHLHVPPFGNGPVHHGNVLRLKMDGPIESIEGAQQPTGFAVKIPGRKSLEPAAPLAARDGRIAGIKVSNDTTGAELTVAFKDGVPNYQVRARGDTLVIALAPAAALEKTVADKDDKGATSAKHHHHKRH